jgi:hypothetical protein
MSANSTHQEGAPLEVPGDSTPGPEIRIPPHPRWTVELLRRRGHTVAFRQKRTGSIAYRIDGGRELKAIEMSGFYARRYET